MINATFTAQLATQAVNRRWEIFPEAVREVARQSLLDWYGVALAGHREPLVNVLLDIARVDGAIPTASLVGQSQRVSLPQAALINGAASHALDFDDVHPFAGHPSAAIVSAVLALAESRQTNGKEFLTAYVAGFEAMCAVGEAMGANHYEKGYHTTATLGVIGAAVACGRLLGMSSATMATAIGIAATQSAGLKINFGTMTKPFHAGHAAHDGLQAARLASAGFTASEMALDGPIGFFAVLGQGEGRWKTAVTSDYYLSGNLFKYHAACYLTHSAIDCASRIARHPRFRSHDVASICITVNPSIKTVCNIVAPASGLAMKFSIAHVVVMALEGLATARPASYSDAEAARIALLPLRQKTTVAFNSDLPLTSARVAVTMKDGATWYEVEDSNTPAQDLSAQRAKLIAKFRVLNSELLGNLACQALIESLLSLDQKIKIAPLMPLPEKLQEGYRHDKR